MGKGLVLIVTGNHGLCPWFQKGYAYEKSRRSVSLPCVRGGVICKANDGGVDEKDNNNPSVTAAPRQLPLHKGAFKNPHRQLLLAVGHVCERKYFRKP